MANNISHKLNEDEQTLLLIRFNNRDELALGEVYDIFYRELQYFARQLYRETNVQAADVVHDIFIKIWESRKIQFKKLDNIKAYIYISLKNGFSDWLSHNKCVNKYNNSIINNKDCFVTEMVESETMSIISSALNILPKDVAAVFKLIVDGWEVKDIAEELNISQSSVYAKKKEGINILKQKLPRNVFMFFISL